MIIQLKKKNTLKIDEFLFRCCVGKNGITKNKIEGDKKTPSGIYNIENLYYRKDRIRLPKNKIKNIPILKQMGWCNDISDKDNYNNLIINNKKLSHEKLYRKDYKYDILIPIKYNFNKKVLGKGSCIFLHITKNYKPTAGCIAISKKDFLIMVKIIKKNSKIKIQ